MTPRQGIACVKRHGVVLQAARGSVPSLAETIAGGRIRGSWWAHTNGTEIYRAADAISESVGGSVFRIDAMQSLTVSPSNGSCPEAIS